MKVKIHPRTSLVVQWLRLCVSTALCAGLIPGLGTKISYAMWGRHKKKKKKKKKIHPVSREKSVWVKYTKKG